MEIGRLAAQKGIPKAELAKAIEGYNSGSKTHRSVCDAVKDERADVGFGLKAAAEEAGLAFIPVTEDEFDFVIRKDVMDAPEIKSFLSVLSSHEFSERLPAGLRTYERTGETISLPEM
jgi:putative molybdopterin biosynthesis protein